MKPCSHCGTLVPGNRCPSCGTRAYSAKAPAAWALLGLTLLGGCVEEPPVAALYGVPACTDDADDDGYCESEGDCDDNDDTINPGAEETAGDGIDSNCDGADDPE